MANEVVPTPVFANKAKRLIKKFHTLRDSLEELEQDLIKNPYIGDPYGANIYKIRLADLSKGKGKSGGFRVITYLIKEDKDSTSIYLITIFDKSEEGSITKEQVKELIKKCDL